ncbi:MAG: translocation/assembly module TamB domain-containing protein [Bacillota bacterium]
MSWKKLIIILILLVLLAAGPWYMYQSGQFARWQLQALLQLESALGIELEYDEASFFPLNRIRLEEMTITDIDDDYQVSITELIITYNFKAFFSNLIIDWFRIDIPGALTASISQVRVRNPDLTYEQEDAGRLNFSQTETVGPDMEPESILKQLEGLPAGVEFLVEGGRLEYREGSRAVAVRPERFEFAFQENANVSLTTGFAGQIILTGLEVERLFFTETDEEILLPYLELNTSFRGRMTRSGWSVDGDLELPRLQDAAGLAARFGSAYGVDELSFSGQQELAFSMAGQGINLQDLLLQGETELASLNFSHEELAEEAAFTDLNQTFSYDHTSGELVIPEFTFKLQQEDRPWQGQGRVNIFAPREEAYWQLGGGTEDIYQLLESLLGEDRLTDLPVPYSEVQELTSVPLPLTWQLEGGFTDSSFWLNGQAGFPDGNVKLAWQDQQIQVEELEWKDQLKATGYYIPAQDEYSFQVDMEEFSPAGISPLISGELPVSDSDLVSASLIGFGQGYTLDDLMVSGQMWSDVLNINDFAITSPYINFWLNQGYLEFGPARAFAPFGKFEFAGGIEVETQQLNLDFNIENLDLAGLAEYTGFTGDIEGQADLLGQITGSISEPEVSADISLPETELYGVAVNDGITRLNYRPGQEVINLERIAFTSRSAEVRGSGQLDLTEILAGESDLPFLEAEFNIQELSYAYLNEIFDLSVPFTGDLSGQFKAVGRLDGPEVQGSATSKSTSLPLGEQIYEFNNSRTDFYWAPGVPFQLRDLRMEHEQTVLKMDADFASEFELEFEFIDYDLNKLEYPALEDFQGVLSARGQAGGSYDDPWAKIQADISDIYFQGDAFGQFSAQVDYESEGLTIEQGDWDPGPGDYTLTGDIKDIFTEPEFDLNLVFADFDLPYYLEMMEFEDIPPVDYYFSGELDLIGTLEDWEVAVDIDGESDITDLGRLNLRGWIGQEYDLSLVGIGLGFDWLSGYLGPDIELGGNLEMIGVIQGELDNPAFELETTIRDLIINQYQLSQINGSVQGELQGIVAVEQELIAQSGQDLRLQGELPVDQPERGSFNLRARNFPLDFIAEFSPQINKFTGSVDGQIDFNGDVEKPELGGLLSLEVGELDFGQPEKLSASGTLDLSGSQIDLVDFTGDYNGGSFQVEGNLDAGNLEEFWQLNLTGRSLALEYMGSSADIDGKLNLIGPLYQPRLGGGLVVNNLIAVLPDNQTAEADGEETDGEETDVEEAEGESSEELEEIQFFQDSTFQPEMDVSLKIGKNNYVRHENAEILIQQGELNLLYLDQLAIEGRLSSTQGNVHFYNNRFTLDTARVTFRRRQGVIPNVSVRASTRAESTDITASLDGPATNLNLTLTSSPPLEEQEILAILARRGGIGEALTGEDVTVFDVVRQEFFRFLSDTFQLEIVDTIQTSIRQAFELDRFEIVTHELGWNEEVSLYIGKDLTDRLYVEGSTIFQEDERESSLSFQYELTDRTALSGTWYGQNEFSLSIETTIEF